MESARAAPPLSSASCVTSGPRSIPAIVPFGCASRPCRQCRHDPGRGAHGVSGQRQDDAAGTAAQEPGFRPYGRDHDLVAVSQESFIELHTGCLCCAVRGDLALTLEDLLARRDAGTVTPF